MIFSLVKKFIHPKIERKIRDIRDEYFRRYKIEELPKEIYSSKLNNYTISFCITCMNRLFHLKKTLRENIKNNIEYPCIEFVLINYNSKDGLDEWVKKNMKEYIDSGILTYYRTDKPELFHASIAKNIAHNVAKGDIVCNLDGDNYTGNDFAYYLNYMFNKEKSNSFFHFTKAPYWGTEGRISFWKEDFLQLGGYDENLMPIGHEDHDLIYRAKAYGYKYNKIQIENFLKYLSNSSAEKAANCTNSSLDYYKLESENRKISNSNISNGKLVANAKGFKSYLLYKNFSKISERYY